MHAVIAVLRRISRLWMIVVQFALVCVCGLAVAATTVFAHYNHRVSIVSQPNSPGSIVALDEPVVVTFSAPMDTDSVAHALAITPQTAVNLQWNPDETVVKIAPPTGWTADQTYHLTLAPTVHSATRAAVDTVDIIFSTRAVLRVAQLYPSNLATSVDRNSPFVVRFTQQMVPRSRVGTLLAIPLIQLTPAIGSVQTWLDTRTVIVRPVNPLDAGKRYRITVPAGATDSLGRRLERAVMHDFTVTAPPRVRINPVDGAIDVAADQAVVYHIPGQWEEAAIAQSLQIEPVTDVKLDVRSSASETTVRVSPQSQWRAATTYTFRQAARDAQNTGFTSTFTTAPLLTLVAQSPADGQLLLPDRELRFVFNTTLDATTVTGAVHFSPAPIRPPVIAADGNTLRIRATWASQSAPVIQIDQSLRGQNGYALTTDIVQSIALDPRATVLSLPGAATDIIDLSTKPAAIITMSPHTSATVTFTALPAAIISALRAGGSATYDPARAGYPPLATYELSTELEPTHSIDLAPLRAVTPATVLFARVIDSSGASESRFLRILPPTITAATINDTLVVAAPPRLPNDTTTYTAFFGTQRLGSGRPDTTGVWHLTHLPFGTIALSDDHVPFDYVERSSGAPVPAQQLALITSATQTTNPVALSVACARSVVEQAATGNISIIDAKLTVVRRQAILWQRGQYIVTTTIQLPDTTASGPAVITCETPGTQTTAPVLISPLQRATATAQRGTSLGLPTLTFFDIARRPLANATIFWLADGTIAQANTDASGSAVVPATVPLTALTLHAAAVAYTVATPVAPPLTLRPLDRWYPASSSIPLHVTGATTELTLTLIRADGERILERTITPTAGIANTSIAPAAGAYTVTLTDGMTTVAASFRIGVVAPNTIDPGALLVPASEPIRWGIDAITPGLWVEQHDDKLVTSWKNERPLSFVTTTPLTDTTAITAAFGTANESFQSPVVRVVPANCAAATIETTAPNVLNTTITVHAPPGAALTIAGQSPTGPLLWLPDLVLPDDETGTVSTTVTALPAGTILTALIASPACLRTISTVVPTQRAFTQQLDAPDAVAIGDVFTLTYTKTGEPADTWATLTLDVRDCAIIDPLPVFTARSDATGTVVFRWHIRVLRAAPMITIADATSPLVTWRPVVQLPTATYTADGFVLTGRTAVDATRQDTRIDILATTNDIAVAIDTDGESAPTVAHTAHLLWLRNGRHSISGYWHTLLQTQHPDGGWGVTGARHSDPLLTADVSIALSRSGTTDPRQQQRIALLHRSALDTTLPLSVRAHALYALAVAGEKDTDTMRVLYSLRETMGSEGVAALLLAIPQYPALDPTPLITVLQTRARPASRGVLWSTDPNTSALHTASAQNVFIYGALEQANAPASLRAASRDYIISTRGTAGWGDAITNARAWDLRRSLFPELTGTQRITITDTTGHNVGSGAQTTPHRIHTKASLWSDAAVVVGIDYPRVMTPPTQDVVLAQRISDDLGNEHAHLGVLPVGAVLTVTTDIIALTDIPYTRITIPAQSLTTLTLISVPEHYAIRAAADGYTLYADEPKPGIWHITYQLRAVRTGTTTVAGLTVTDSADTLLAASPAETLYVSDR